MPSERFADAMSLCNSQGSKERSLVLHLKLTTFAGEEIQLAIDLQEYDRLNEFEDAVLNQLPCLGDSSTFGCELQFVHKDTLPFVLCIYKTLTDNHVEAVIVTQSVPNGVDQHFVEQKPFESHPALLIGYCLKPFRSTRKCGTFRLKQESALWVRLLGGAASDCRWSTCRTQSSAYSMERFADVTCSVL